MAHGRHLGLCDRRMGRLCRVALGLLGGTMTRAAQPPLFELECAPRKRTRSDWSETVKGFSNVRPEPAPRPWLCSILAVDTARNSGWAHWRNGELMDSGEVLTTRYEELDTIVGDFVSTAVGLESARVLVMERPWGGGTENVTGLLMARERWQRAWIDAGEARMRTCTVHPSTWRAKVLGNVRGLRTLEIQERERRAAVDISGLYSGDLGSDQCAAICIGKWASHASLVGQKIGARAVQASMAAWRTR